MRFWNFEIKWVTPEAEVRVTPSTVEVKKPTVPKATTRPKKVKDENKKPVRTTKARKVTKST